MTDRSSWRLRARTVEAMALLVVASVAVRLVPFAWWRPRLGRRGQESETGLIEARRLAVHVERGASRLPFPTKCLPRALALSAMLRRRGITHQVVLAARPASARTADEDDGLHAWVAAGPVVVLGELPGPWLEVISLPQTSQSQA